MAGSQRSIRGCPASGVEATRTWIEELFGLAHTIARRLISQHKPVHDVVFQANSRSSDGKLRSVKNDVRHGEEEYGGVTEAVY